MTNLGNVLQSKAITLPTKVHLVKAMVFPVVMHGCESWAIQKAECQKIGAFELWGWRRLSRVHWMARRSNQLTLEEINPEHSFIRRTDAEVAAPILWPPDEESWITGKDPDAGKDWGQEEKGVTEDEMVGWHHRLSGHKFEQTLGDSEGQGSLACCSPWGRRESGMTEWLKSKFLQPCVCFIYRISSSGLVALQVLGSCMRVIIISDSCRDRMTGDSYQH